MTKIHLFLQLEFSSDPLNSTKKNKGWQQSNLQIFSKIDMVLNASAGRTNTLKWLRFLYINLLFYLLNAGHPHNIILNMPLGRDGHEGPSKYLIGISGVSHVIPKHLGTTGLK